MDVLYKYIIIKKKYSTYFYDSSLMSMTNNQYFQGFCIEQNSEYIKLLEPYYPLHFRNKSNMYRIIKINYKNIKNIKLHIIHLIEKKYNLPKEITLNILGYLLDIESYKENILFKLC